MMFLVFCSALTVSLAIFRSDKSDVQQNSFGAVVLHDNSQYKYKSKIQNKLVGEEYLFNDIKLTVADNTSPVFIRAHVYFDSTNEVAKDKIKFNSFSIKNHENYTWSRFGDYWYLCDKSGNLMQLNSTKAGEVYVFLIQSDAVVPEMQGVLGDDEFVSCEIVVQSSLASNFSNTTNFSEINKSFDKNATETTKTGTYSVVFKQNGATLSTQTINYGGKANIPEVTTAEGDVFLCWNTREDGSGANITNEQLGYITQNLTLFPMFENQKVLVTVVQSEGGTISPETQMVDWGSDLVMHFTPNKNYVLKRILIDGNPVGATSEYLLKRITGAVVVSAEFVSDYIVLDKNGGAGEQPNVVYNGDQTKFMLEGNEPTKSGKEFYYYSTNSADNEQGQNGDRYDLGYWYDVPNTSGTTTLFAIYLTPSSNYQTAQNYVVVPKNVSAIADSAVNMFSGTNNTVKFVTLPRQTSKIGKNAFANCSGLVGVSMSDFVTSIGESTFKSDSALTNFRAPTSLQTLGQTAFSGCTSLSKVKNLDATSITEIPSDCFAGCSKLEEIVLPANISKIRVGAFASSGLKTINLEDTKLEELGSSAFKSCSALTQVTVPSTLKTMGQAVFMFSGITEVKNFAGTSVSKIESMAFYSSKLIQIEFPESLVSIDNSAFASCSELTRVGGLQNTKVTQIEDSAFSGCSKLKNVIFPQTLLTLGGSAYSGCSALTSVTFNSNLKTIGANAFEGCSSLSQLTGLEKTVVSSIGANAFKGCSSLVDVSLPNTIQTVGENAFANCSGLATINFINDSNLSTLSVAANSFTGTTSDLKVNILDESHFDEYISKLNGKGFAENAFMFFLGNIDRKAYYKNAVWEKFHDAVITSTAGEHGTISPSGAVVYSLGSSASYVISPETGYKIKKILVDGVEIVITAADGAAQSYEFVDIQKDHTISAEFEQRMFKITVICGENGKIEPSESADYAYGSNVTFVITPNDGYVIKDVLIDGVSNAKAKENAKYTFSNLRSNHEIEVSFEVVTFTIVSSVGEGGTMSPNQITTIKNWGENHSVTYTPNDKFVISTIVVDGEVINLSGVDVSNPYTYTFSNITANHVISCQFESTQRTLTYDPNGGTFVLNTDIDLPSSTGNYNYRAIATIGFAPSTTYSINFASATLISGTATEFHVLLYKFGDPQKRYATIKVPFGTNVSAVFTSPETLNPSDNNQILVYAGLAGSTAGNSVSFRGITMSVTKTLTWDSVCGVSPTPTREGYNFKGWSTESEGSTQDFSNKTYSSVFGKEDGWLYAIWEIKQFKITTEAGAHGTITESMTVDWGTTATVEMKPDEGYRVATYSIDGGNAINSTAKAGDSDYYTFRNITANHTISVTFAPITYTIKYNGNGATSGSTTSSSHTYDEEKELTANGFSRTGYNFAGWATKDAIAATNATAVTNGTTMTGNVGSGSDSIGTYFTKDATTSTNQWWAGLACSNYYVTAGRTYIWTIEVYHEMGKTMRNQMDANVLYTGATNNDDGYGGSAVITPQQIPSGVWTTLTIRVKIIAGVANPYICHSFCPTNYVDGTKFETAAKIYYRNSRIVEFEANPPEYMNCQKVKNLSAEQGKVVELYAVWAANTYVMTLDENNRTNLKTKNVVYDQPYGTFDVPSKTGYTYVGWRVGKRLIDEKTFNGSSDYINLGRTYMYTNKITVMARAYMDDWTQYKNGMRIISCTEGGGWNLEPNGDYLQFAIYDSGVGYKVAKSNISFANLASGWHTFVANFDGEYARLYIDGIGVGKSEKFSSGKIGYHASNSILVGAEAGSSSSPVGSYFKGKISYVSIFNSSNYYTKDTISSAKCPAYNTVAVAHWTPNTYSITFKADEASIYEKYWNYAGSTGYTSSNAGSYSKYTLADSRKSPTYANAVYDSTLSVYTPIPQRLGYTFVGWYSSKSGGVKVADANGSLVASATGFTGAIKQWQNANNITLYAQWSVNTYAVEYAMNGGTKGSTSPSSYTFGTTTTISDPTRNGYTFAGWSVVATLDGKRSGTINMNSGILEYNSSYANAVYFPLFYQKAGVSYTGKLGGGEIRWRQWHTTGGYSGNASTSNTFATSEAKLLSLWYHLGMSDDTTTLSWNGGKSFKIDANQVGKLTLTANWTPNKITITLNKNGGSGGTDKFYYTYGINKFYSDANLTQELTSMTFPTRGGYTFSHYYGDGTCGGNKDEQYSMTTSGVTSTDLYTDIYKDATLYAKWNGIQYTITLDNNGGSGGSLGKTTYTTSPSAQTISITNPTAKTGYHFDYYTFNGYSGSTPSISGTTLTIPANTYGNLTITAIWSPNTYTVHYSPYGSTIENLLSFDPSFESTATGTISGWTNQAGNATIKVVSGTAYGGNKSLQIAGADGGSYRIYKTCPGIMNGTYKFSAYLKTSGSGSIRIELYGGDYSWAGYSKSYTGNGSWQRLEVSIPKLTSDTTIYAFLYTGSATTYYDDVYLTRSAQFSSTLYEATATYDAEMPKVTLPTRAGYSFGGYFSSVPSYTNQSSSQNNLMSDSSPTWRIGIGTSSGYSSSALQVGYMLKFYFTYSTTATLNSIDINDVNYTDYCVIDTTGTKKVVYGIVTLTSLGYVNQYSFIDLNFSENTSVSVTVNTLAICSTKNIQYYTSKGSSQKVYKLTSGISLYADWFVSKQTYKVSCETTLSGWNAWTVGSSAHTNCFIYDGNTILCNGVSGFENLYIPVTIPSGWTTTFSWRCTMPTISADYAGIGAGKMRVQLLNYVPTDGSNVGNELAYVEMASDASSSFSMTYSTAGTYYLVLNFGFCNDGSLLKYQFAGIKMVSTKTATSSVTLPAISTRKNNTANYWVYDRNNYSANSTFLVTDNAELTADYTTNKVNVGFYVYSKSYWTSASIYINGTQKYSDSQLKVGSKITVGTYDAGTTMKFVATVTKLAEKKKQYGVKFWDRYEVNDSTTASETVTIEVELGDDDLQWIIRDHDSACVAEGTLITLADGTKKKVEDLTLSDKLLIFNHETGKYDVASINFIENDGRKVYDIINLKFSNGVTSRVIYEHGYFDLDLNKYVYIRDNTYKQYIGHRFYSENGVVTLVDAFMTTERTGCYSLVTSYHLNYFTDGVLSMPGGISGLFNIFEYDEDLKFNQDDMKLAIEEFGLFEYEDFADYVSKEEFDSYPTKYLKISMARGLMTWEDIEYLITRYCNK